MDIHSEVDNILANVSQPPQLRFEFHQNGCTIILCDSIGEHKHKMTPYDLLRLGIESNFLFRAMQLGTVSYFTQEQS
jgi:hypothetical protein